MKKIFIFALLALTLAACSSSKQETVADFFSSASTTPTGETITVDPVISKSYMWLSHKVVKGSPRYTHIATNTGSWTQPCKIDLSNASFANRDITCVTESTELDLMQMGLDLEYNVPNHQACPYVLTMAPYFFQYPPPQPDGTATAKIPPTYVVVTKNAGAASADYDAKGYYSDAKTTENTQIVVKGGTYKCKFDYTDLKGPNCCSGDYTEEVNETSETGTTKITYSTKSWGGDPSNCLSGPALTLNKSSNTSSKWPAVKVWRMQDQETSIMSDQSLLSQNNLNPKLFSLENKPAQIPQLNFQLNQFKTPIEIINTLNVSAKATTSDGIYGTLSISSLFNQLFKTSRYLATYISGTKPKAFTDVLDYYEVTIDGFKKRTEYADPNYYTVICADDALEIKARIKLRVREWNTLSALSKGLEPTAGEDNASGAETDLPTSPNNDFYDWEDDEATWDASFPWEDTNSDTVNDLPTYPGITL